MRISNMITGAQNCYDLVEGEELHPKYLSQNVTKVTFTILVYCHECVLDAKIIFDLSAFSADSL